ncbi:hypothetical protein OOT46_26545 [Aquabacterium sp. A7-Y]|uniref:hypothetical protein n=1 Tax=Aquabacterium sp. A7-Y TaxID=1349605 RepID=UPI00223CA99D|nr:hypothetical protein [Aquabacterium sp. A7-Y]MCW7541376.1 hypothetical protein [Aquabacterium sp. A7-Y]
MGCCAPNAVGPGSAAADSCKRVNYTLGMLLGVDDFVQESAYHIARRHELARELLGYGTVHGLQVVVEADGDSGPRLRVMPGMAWLPSGTPVCVSSAQCAHLNDWLAAHASELPAASPMSRLTLYVVLSHAQCLTDNVPIPGEPCRSDDELMQASRVADGFRLELRLAPPPQREEEAIRDFVAWLLALPAVPSSPPLTEAEFVEQLREAARYWLAPTSPPTSPPDFMLGAAPAGTSDALFTTALRLWTTELRPLWMARSDCGCSMEPIAPKDDAVLLTELQVELVNTAEGWRVSDASDAVLQDESRRPFLLSLRMLQELIARHPAPDPGDSVVTEYAFGQAPDAGVSLQFSRADHTHGTPAWPELGGDLTGPIDDARIDSLQGVPLGAASPLVDGQVLTVEGGQWVPRTPGQPGPPERTDLAGDVSGPPASNQIVLLQGHRLNAYEPGANQILRYIEGEWMTVDLPQVPPVSGEFVDRGDPVRRYQIVAAAEVDLLLRPGGRQPPQLRHRYGEIEGLGAMVDPQQPERAVIGLRVTARDARQFSGHIVKLTPVWTVRTRFGFRLYLLEEVVHEGQAFIEFRVLLLADQAIAGNEELPFRFQVELSRFEEVAT